ncbi:MAG: T9SS type A sorting domain-containing protein [Bacteroidia bacterium]|nr:T9SS type A sorting domain-containing protein [Bacteroidia bacterium]
MRYFFIGATLLSAQPLPDRITFVGHGDTLYADCWTFPGGWTAHLWRLNAGQSTLFRRDSFFIDSLRRLRLYVVYLPYAPAERWRIDYPESHRAAFTEEIYDSTLGSFKPRRRFMLWKGPSQWDSLLRSWLGIFSIDWSHYEGALPFPHPTLSESVLWGDSLIVEEFLPDAQVYVVTGGYERRSGTTCDTLLLYEQQGILRVGRGMQLLCALSNGKLSYTRDTTCSQVECMSSERFFSYDGAGRLLEDSVVIRSYTLQGQLLGSVAFPKRYFWDGQGRLIQAIYSGGAYQLSYGSQIVSLGIGGEASSQSSLFPQVVRIYDLQGKMICQGFIDSQSEIKLPAEIPSGVYLLRTGDKFSKLVWHSP